MVLKKAKKRNRAKRETKQYKDTHHLFWPQHDFNRGWAKTLRTHWYCRVDIPMLTLHRRIHHEITRVPVPKAISVKGALEQLNLLEKYGAIHPYDNIERRLYVLMALFDCCEPEVHAALKSQYDIVRKHFHSNPR